MEWNNGEFEDDELFDEENEEMLREAIRELLKGQDEDYRKRMKSEIKAYNPVIIKRCMDFREFLMTTFREQGVPEEDFKFKIEFDLYFNNVCLKVFFNEYSQAFETYGKENKMEFDSHFVLADNFSVIPHTDGSVEIVFEYKNAFIFYNKMEQ